MLQTVLESLSNGVRIIVHPMPYVHSFSAGVFVHTGSRNETPVTNGISHFLEHMAFKGTSAHDVQQLNFAAEHLGASMNAFTSKEMTAYFINGLSKHASSIVGLLSEIVCDSTFPEEEIDREREVILQEELEYAEDPGDVAHQLLCKAAFGKQRLSMPIIGSRKNIAGFTTNDLRRYVSQQYTGPNIVVAIAGNIDAGEMIRQCEQLFSGLPTGTRHQVDVPSHIGGVQVKKFARVSQVFSNIAFPIASMSDADGHYAALLAGITFGGGMSSPLVDQVRERMGLAYQVGATSDIADLYGHFSIDAITTPESLTDFYRATSALLRAHAGNVDPAQIDRARNQLSVGLVTTVERPFRAIQRSAEDLLACNRIISEGEALERVQAVTAEDVRNVFERMLKQPPAMSLVGKLASKTPCEEFASSFL